MKSRKITSHKVFGVVWRIALIAIILIALMYAVVKGFMLLTESEDSSYEKVDSKPRQVVTINEPFVGKTHFNNVVGKEDTLDIVKSKIEGSLHSVEIAVFSFASTELKEALYAADRRGVKVTLILDKSQSEKHDVFFGDLPPTIRRIDAGTYSKNNSLGTTYMHNKFVIIDRGFPSAEILTGSLNFTTLGGKYTQSFQIETKDTDIISIYGKEFNRLKSGVFGVKKFEDETYDPWAVTLNYSDSFIEIWFSPGTTEESLKHRVLDLINSSTKSIDIMMWELTTDEIAYDLAAKAKEGVRVRVIASEARVAKKDSSIPYIQSTKALEKIDNLEIVLDTKLSGQSLDKLPDNFSPFIHHHMMIVDGKTLIMGSGNWSLWGFYHNDENALVTNNTYLISESQKTFDYFYEALK